MSRRIAVPSRYNAEGAARTDETAPNHLKSVFWAAGLGVLELTTIQPDCLPFPSSRPGRVPRLSIVLADLLNAPARPDAFDQESLTRLLKTSGGVFVMSGAPVAELYESAAAFAIATGMSAVLLEVSADLADDWRAFLAKARPDVTFDEINAAWTNGADGVDAGGAVH